jgi:hypothetical protein
MFISKWTAVTLAASALTGATVSAVNALGDQGQQGGQHHQRSRSVLTTSIAPSVPTDPMLLGSAAGGAPWVLRSGEARLRSNGRLDVSIRGLVIPTTGTARPVTTVDASLYCGGNPTPVGTSASFPISAGGNARISARFTLPSKCQIPALLIHPNGLSGIYIASSGFGG